MIKTHAALPVLMGAVCFSFGFAEPVAELVQRASPLPSLTEPPCSYASTQNRKGFTRPGDRAVAWIRGAHNGGAIPIRLFISVPRVINDTYGLFFYDPDGGYVSAFRKDYGYQVHGWRRGVMIVRGKDGTLWSALSGVAIEGPQKGKQLERTPSMLTSWEHWLMLHPESTAYDLFDGKKYPAAPLPETMTEEARKTMGKVDARLEPLSMVLGVEAGSARKAYPLDQSVERACYRDKIGTDEFAVFWYKPTQTAVAFRSRLGDRQLTLYADDVSPDTAPFKDKETGSRWTLAGRAVDGPLKGQELTWISSLHCRWYAWSAENPETMVYAPVR